jgi:hypothetical protein
MITRFAHKIKASAFSALLAYVLLLNVLLAGFAQAAMFDHAANSTAVICTVATSSGDNAAAPEKALMQHCQMCCLAAQDDLGLPPIVSQLLARLGVVSAKQFPLEIAGTHFTKTQFTEARGPPVI